MFRISSGTQTFSNISARIWKEWPKVSPNKGNPYGKS